MPSTHRARLIESITIQPLGEKWQDWLLGVKNAAKIDNKIAPKKPELPNPLPMGGASAPPTPGETPPTPPADE